MDPDERDQLVNDIKWRADIESRLANLEGLKKTLTLALAAGAAALASNIWEPLKEVIFNVH